MNRLELRQLAEERLLDARALLAAGRWSAAYYIAGYAVECGLKACIMALVERTGIIFEDKKFAEKCWTHDPAMLAVSAGLEDTLEGEKLVNNPFSLKWDIVADWAEVSRYRSHSQVKAEVFCNAIMDAQNGVMQRIKLHW